MRKRLYGILAAVFLCTWKAEKTEAELNTNMKLIEQFYMYNDSDMLYNLANYEVTEEIRNIAVAYAKEHPHPIVGSHSIMKQYIYLNAIRTETYGEYNDMKRTAIMLNFFLTVEAYSAAVSFRVCAFYYYYVIHNPLKSAVCTIVSSYMEWYFSFMLEEKAEDLCTIKNYFDEELNKPLKAEYVCNLLRKLNLNFLRFPGDKTSINPLQDDEHNIYKSEKLTSQDPVTGEKRFISIFEKYRVPKKEKSERLEVYYKKVYPEIWNSVMDAYNDNFFVLMSYFFEVTRRIPHPPHAKPRMTKFISMTMWNKVFEFFKIMNLPTETQRGVVFEENIKSAIGSVIYRSNAIEILRQSSYYSVYPKLINAGLNVHDIMTIINSSNLECILMVTSNLSVDYCFHICPS